MVESKNCTVSANFDSGTFMNIGLSAPLHKHQYQNNIQDEYNLSFEDFNNLEILISGAIDKYLDYKKEQNGNRLQTSDGFGRYQNETN